MKKNIVIIACTLSLCSCNIRNKNSLEYEKQYDYISNYLISNTISVFESYSICGNLSDELSDINMRNYLQKFPDSIIDIGDIDTMISQYKQLKGKDLKLIFNFDNMKVIEKLDEYSTYSFYANHFAFSPPLISRNGETCVVYLHGYFAIDKTQNGVFVTFRKKNESWDFLSNVFFESQKFSEGFHYHDYTLVKQEFLIK